MHSIEWNPYQTEYIETSVKNIETSLGNLEMRMAKLEESDLTKNCDIETMNRRCDALTKNK